MSYHAQNAALIPQNSVQLVLLTDRENVFREARGDPYDRGKKVVESLYGAGSCLGNRAVAWIRTKESPRERSCTSRSPVEADAAGLRRRLERWCRRDWHLLRGMLVPQDTQALRSRDMYHLSLTVEASLHPSLVPMLRQRQQSFFSSTGLLSESSRPGASQSELTWPLYLSIAQRLRR
jgi:hypothetical protein